MIALSHHKRYTFLFVAKLEAWRAIHSARIGSRRREPIVCYENASSVIAL